ncbi:integrase, catalytic region, zinc finger, CCHC-type containing protein [Tanacetum coccineum]|uniref:Integrase, catalytic region, zinc finger, CCHC-type containing protein n=1 Tax=Tanacetum coccineum TaxID=301880 RepID=A0ABQ5BW47_9ASTR
MPSESPLIKELDKIKVGFEKLSLLIQQNCKRASIFYTSPAEIEINDFCQDQVKPILNELKVYLECFQNLFQRDIKEMKDIFESTESELDELEKQNELLKDQLLKASLKHDVELFKKKSFEIQEDLQAKIKILENDVQRCEKQSVDFQLKLQHKREKQKWDSTLKNKNKIPLYYSWISKMEKLEDENVSLDFTVQSLIKERDNAKMEYKKLFDSIKKTRSQTQKEMDELIVHVSEKTYAYGAIRAENQNLLTTISELKKRLEKVEKGMNATSRVRRPMSRDSHVAHSVLDNSKNAKRNVAVYVRKNKQEDVIPNKENVIDVDVANASTRKLWTRFSEKKTQSKTLDTTFVVSKSKIDVESASKAKDKIWKGVIAHRRKRFLIFIPISIYDHAVLHRMSHVQSNFYKVMVMAPKTVHIICGTINDLTRLDLVDGLPKFKYGKDHLCSAYERGKSKKASHPPKLVPSDHSKLELLHMDLCGPMRVASINGKRYILVIVDDYSRYTWVYFLRSKDETPEIIKKSIAQAQLNLQSHKFVES